MNAEVPLRRRALYVAARADCDLRTARRALVEGIEAVRGANLRDRLRRAVSALDSQLERDRP